MPFSFTDIPGLVVFEPKVFEDSRGYFFEAYNESLFLDQGISFRFIQDNQSFSRYGVIRGLHYQMEPHGDDLKRCRIGNTPAFHHLLGNLHLFRHLGSQPSAAVYQYPGTAHFCKVP